LQTIREDLPVAEDLIRELSEESLLALYYILEEHESLVTEKPDVHLFMWSVFQDLV